jgi:DnaK suppressor protein
MQGVVIMATSAQKKSAPHRKPAVKKKAAPAAEPSAGTAEKTPARKQTARKAPTKRVAAVKTSENKTAAPSTSKKAAKPDKLIVGAGETPWSAEELAELRAELEADAKHLREEIRLAEQEIQGLFRDGGDGAGNDQADVGSNTLERDNEMYVANNARSMLTQTEHALSKLHDGTYGVCEDCGNPIGKGRLQAFPRATLCVSCKEREERR